MSPPNPNNVIAFPTGGKGQRKVLFADPGTTKFQGVIQWLERDKVEVEAVTDPEKFLARITQDWFDICVVNLLLGGNGPFEMVAKVRTHAKNRDMRIIVTSRQHQKVNIQNSIRAGASDFISEPFENENMYQRILYHLTPKKLISQGSFEAEGFAVGVDKTNLDYVGAVVQAIESLSRSTRETQHAALTNILIGVAKLTGSNRTSLVVVDVEAGEGSVLGSSDDPKIYNFPIKLSKYPEILHALHTENLVIVEDVARNAMTEQIPDQVKTIHIGSLMVFPVWFRGDVVGVLTVRRPQAIEIPGNMTLRLMQALANTLAAYSYNEAVLRRVYSGFQNWKNKATA